MGVTDRTPRHPEHDPFLIAQYAADDLRPSERPRATELIESCRECASLAADLGLTLEGFSREGLWGIVRDASE